MRHQFRASYIFSLVLLALGAAWAANPSLLIMSPSGAAGGYVDLDYLKELHQQHHPRG